MAQLLQIFISVLANLHFGVCILDMKCEGKHHIHKLVSTYTAHSNIPGKENLNCSENEMQGALIYWKKQDQRLARNDAQLEITISEAPDAGVFTCWNETTDELLSCHTVLLMRKTANGEMVYPMLTPFEELSGTDQYLKCMANSYSGNFTCSWKLARQDPNLKFTITTKNSGSIPVICDEPVRNSIGENSEIYTVSCRKENSCPSAEEYQNVAIKLEVLHRSVYVFEDHISSFFIKDIIKPDASECQIAKNGDRAKLTWTHPKTWSIPESYFGLTYQIETVKYSNSDWKKPSVTIYEVDNTTVLRNGSTLSCYFDLTKNARFRIRSRDRYNKNDSAWSSWSEPCRGGFQRNDKSHNHNQEGKTKVESYKCQKN